MSINGLKQRFRTADPRFGPVPFWWWSAEEITEERVRWQLQKFRSGGLRNIGIINIAPTGPQYGSVSDNPPYFSERWWAMFEVALREAQRLGMRLYFYDQIGFSGSNFPARIVTEHPHCAGYALRRYSLNERLPDGAEPLLETSAHRYAAERQGFNWLDPDAAAMLFDRVHGEFERRFPHDLGRTIAGSFQDELPPLPLWTAEMPRLYEERYGQELLPLLPGLFDELPFSAGVRRRVYELAAELAERAVFKPLHDWHVRYDMLLCCDQAGPARRADVHGAQRLYLDYFRTHRWYSAPGSDGDGEIKPHSSMAHLHGGKRVFVEAFHTSGWGGTLEETLHWLIPWLQAGATLYSPHSVYYSTRGGWWEWAPPDTGWRQPYYEHYAIFADTVSRVCSLLSEGEHVADIAVHYPSHAVSGYLSLDDAQPGEHPMAVANRMPCAELEHIHDVYVQVTGRWNRRDRNMTGALRSARLDYDIADDSALEKAVVENGLLRIAEERFSVLLLCGTTVMDDAARSSVESWLAAGGFVIGVDVPAGNPAIEGVLYADSPDEAVRLIQARIPGRIQGDGMSLHRRTADADIFLLLPGDGQLLAMHEPASTERSCEERSAYKLRTAGEPQLWDPVTGHMRPLPCKREGDWIEVEVPFADWPAALVVCADFGCDADALAAGGKEELRRPAAECWADKGKLAGGLADGLTDAAPAAPFPAAAALPERMSSVRELAADRWRVLAVPTLDNRYGDFDLHGERTQYLPVERRTVLVNQELTADDGVAAGWHRGEYDDTAWTTRLWSEADYWLACKGDRFEPEQAWPVVYSNRLGDMKFRTWAGRMGRVPRRFLNLGRARQGEFVCARTHVIAPADGQYWMRIESNADVACRINGERVEWTGGPEERTAWLRLREGGNELELRAQAITDGLIRAGVEVASEARASLPKWIYAGSPRANGSLGKRFAAQADKIAQRVRLVFAARGRAVLVVNGMRVTEHGDFNPYIRQGQEEADITRWWTGGVNEIRFLLPEGKGEVLADGVIEWFDGTKQTFCTGEDWLDEQGGKPSVLHESVLEFAETETLWLNPYPHPLPHVGWLMPDAAANPEPLPFHHDPARIGKPVWLRFPLPAGARSLSLSCAGAARVWIGGEELALRGGQASFPAQTAGTEAAVRVQPSGPFAGADVLQAPPRFGTAPVKGALGDWRTALCLPHHSGSVEYETEIELGACRQRLLDLGHVRGTAEAWLDGRPLGVRAWRPYRFALEADAAPGKHHLRIRVTNTLGAHYEVGRPTSNVGGNADTSVSFWTREGEMNPAWSGLFASGGLFGPVRLLE